MRTLLQKDLMLSGPLDACFDMNEDLQHYKSGTKQGTGFLLLICFQLLSFCFIFRSLSNLRWKTSVWTLRQNNWLGTNKRRCALLDNCKFMGKKLGRIRYIFTCSYLRNTASIGILQACFDYTETKYRRSWLLVSLAYFELCLPIQAALFCCHKILLLHTCLSIRGEIPLYTCVCMLQDFQVRGLYLYTVRHHWGWLRHSCGLHIAIYGQAAALGLFFGVRWCIHYMATPFRVEISLARNKTIMKLYRLEALTLQNAHIVANATQ